MTSAAKKEFSWKVALVMAMCAGLLALSVSIFFQTRVRTVDALVATNSELSVTATAPVGLGISFEAPSKPARLIIPSIGVDATIQNVGLAWQGTGEMGIPTNFTDVGWYKDGPIPGEPGSAVIDGHLDGKDVKEAVFYNLGSLTQGDIVNVLDVGGKTREFKVVAVKTYDLDAPTDDIFSKDKSAVRLNLITCAGNWLKGKGSYSKRVVVFTELVTTN